MRAMAEPEDDPDAPDPDPPEIFGALEFEMALRRACFEAATEFRIADDMYHYYEGAVVQLGRSELQQGKPVEPRHHARGVARVFIKTFAGWAVHMPAVGMRH